jgi:hypothetical protein
MSLKAVAVIGWENIQKVLKDKRDRFVGQTQRVILNELDLKTLYNEIKSYDGINRNDLYCGPEDAPRHEANYRLFYTTNCDWSKMMEEIATIMEEKAYLKKIGVGGVE